LRFFFNPLEPIPRKVENVEMFTTIALKAHEKTPTIEMEFG
jgi:hypothetical protein